MKARIAEFKMLLAADKKQATILAGLLVFLVISAGRMALNMSPSKASARQSSSSKVDEQVAAVGSGGERTAIKLKALPDTARDIFALNPEKFPEPVRPEQSAHEQPKSDAGNVEAEVVETLSEQELNERMVRGEAAKLRLRSTILGASPIMVIEAASNKKTRSVVLGVGDEVDGFSVIEIRRFSVLIEKNGVRVELTRELPDA